MDSRSALSLWKKLGLPGEPSSVGEGLYAHVVNITVDMAKEILSLFNEGNRTKKWKSIERYLRDMNDGIWRLTHEAIAFADIPKLLDGQNRLEAIVKSEKSLKVLVVIGLPAEVATAINEGQNRSGSDAALVAGMDTTQQRIAVAKNLHRGYDHLHEPISNPRALELLVKFEETLNWLQANVPKETGVTTAGTVLAAIGRCHIANRTNTRKVGVIKQFCQILQTGQYEKLDPVFANAWRLRERMVSHRYYGGQSHVLYALVEYILMKTLAGVALSRLPSDDKLRDFAQEWFPFPGENVLEESCDTVEGEGEVGNGRAATAVPVGRR